MPAEAVAAAGAGRSEEAARERAAAADLMAAHVAEVARVAVEDPRVVAVIWGQAAAADSEAVAEWAD